MLRPIISVEEFKNAYFDIPYGNISEAQKMDIFLPEEEKDSFPVIVSIHGGAFKVGDKRNGEMIDLMLPGLKKGYAVVGVNYRLSGEAKFPEAVRDIKRAIRFIKANSNKYNLDAEKIIVWGGSAGGYFTLMSAVSNGIEYFDDNTDPNIEIDTKIKGAIAWFPPVNFLTMDNHLKESGLLRKIPDHSDVNSPESLFIGASIEENKEIVKKANPETYISKKLPPSLYIQHGRVDRIVPYQQSEEFYNKVKAITKEKIIYEIIEEADHGDSKFETEENLNKIFKFIEEVVNK